MDRPTPWTAEQEAILDHPDDAHALVRAVPGAGKTTTLVGRVDRLVGRGVDPRRIRVVMFNRTIAEFFRERLAALEITGVRVNTFDSLGLEVLRAAERRGLLQRALEVVVDGAERWAREVARRQDPPLDPEALVDAIGFWKAHLVTPARAAFPGHEALVAAYRQCEALRLDGGVLRVAFSDMVYTAARALKEAPALLGPVDHLLVDEFQDVNLARVTLIQRLVGRHTAIMAVGDEDQAINEWCGAHPRFFRDFAALFPGLPSREYPLSQSFRLGPTLAAAATRLIRHGEGSEAREIVGAGATPGSIVDIDDVPATVRDLLGEGVPAGEIAVLYRSRGQGVAAVAGLAAAGIAIDTEDFEWIRRSRAAALILAHLRFATSDLRPTPADAWRIVFAPERYIHKELFGRQLARRGDWGLTAVLADGALARELGQSATAVAAMTELAATLQRMGRCDRVGDAVAILAAHVDLEAQLAGAQRGDRARAREAESTALNAVLSLFQGLEASPAGAAQALASLDPARGAPPEDRIWVSTIHRAKGKEWSHVLLPALADGLCPAEDRGSIPGTQEAPEGPPQSPWLAQERRIFYVGLTRARARVYVQAQGPAPSQFLAELRPPAPIVRAVPKRRRSSAVTSEATSEGTSEAVGPTPRAEASGKPWSRREREALRAAWERGASLETIADELGRSAAAVAHRALRLGLVDDLDGVLARRSS